MVGAKPIMVAALVGVMGYAAYPYVTLYRLGHAIRSGDAATLQTLVDWSSVREGIKEDICDAVADNPETASSNGKLPDFGASFVRGIAANTIDEQVTPSWLTGVVMHEAHDSQPRGAAVHVNWAFFDRPTTFYVSLNAPGQASPIKLQMELKGVEWRVTRVSLPETLLAQANART